jgi:hypothetical protein
MDYESKCAYPDLDPIFADIARRLDAAEEEIAALKAGCLPDLTPAKPEPEPLPQRPVVPDIEEPAEKRSAS